jgi:polyhydroxybutyrate depolymerase
MTEHRGTLMSGGYERSFHVVAPDTPPTSLVLVLHGSNSDAPSLRELSGRTFDRLTRAGALVVYPESHGGMWNDARLGTRAPARDLGIDDVAFLRSLIARLAGEYAVPQARTFAVGFSNGGQMVIRLLMQAPDLLGGAALIGSNHPAPDNVLPEVARLDRHTPVPVLTVNGTRDPIVPFDGGIASLWGFKPRGRVLSSLDSAGLFAHRNGHTDPPVVEQVTTGRMRTTRTSWRQDGLAPVDFFAITRGGHTVPNRDHRAPFLLGRTQRDLDAGELVAEFFGLSTPV